MRIYGHNKNYIKREYCHKMDMFLWKQATQNIVLDLYAKLQSGTSGNKAANFKIEIT
jgi:hypothetical protein